MSPQNRDRIAGMGMVLLTLAVICAILLERKTTITANTGAPVVARPQVAPPPMPSAPAPGSVPAEMSQVIDINPNEVLASVNGKTLKLADIMPAVATNNAGQVAMDKMTLDYYLKRAVDRELIFQKAHEQGIALNDSQNAQLAAFQLARNQPEPGAMARLNSSPSATQLEVQDAEAFMLQTTLMTAQGASPNVTEDQVKAYYSRHQSEYGGMPLESLQNDQPAWLQVQEQIRYALASQVRSTYNNQVSDFMHNLEHQAQITLNPLASL